MTALSKEQRKRLAELQREVDDGKELVERYHRGHTNFDATYVGNKLADAKKAFAEYMESITTKESKMDDGYEPSSNPSFKLKATVQTYELSLVDLAKLFSAQLGVPESRIEIKQRTQFIHGDSIGEGYHGFDGLTITVKN